MIRARPGQRGEFGPRRRGQLAAKYRTEFNPACSCKRPGQSWADALGKDEAVEPGDVVVTEERAKQMSQPPAQKVVSGGRRPVHKETADSTDLT